MVNELKPVEVLMIEDNRGNVVLVQAAMDKAGLTHHLTVVSDGAEAVEFLFRRGKYADSPRPGLIMLDLKLPRKNGREVLDDIQADSVLREIPLVIVSSSRSELELSRVYKLPSECYLEKPSTFQGFVELVQAIEAFRCKADSLTPTPLPRCGGEGGPKPGSGVPADSLPRSGERGRGEGPKEEES